MATIQVELANARDFLDRLTSGSLILRRNKKDVTRSEISVVKREYHSWKGYSLASGRRSAAKLLSKDEARRIAVSIAKLRRVNTITRPLLTFCQKLSASGSVCSTAISREEKSNVTQNAHHTNGHCGTGPRLDRYG